MLHINHDVGFDDPDLSVHNHLRHLLQVGYTDHLVGELLARLRRTGLLERALLVVTADHGYSFRVGVESRRLMSERNVEEIAPVPLFVKAPGQMEGKVDRSLAWQPRHRRDDRRPARHARLLPAGRALGVLAMRSGRAASIAVSTRDFAARRARSGCGSSSAGARRGGAAGRGCSGRAPRATCLYGDPWARAYRHRPAPRAARPPRERPCA